MRLALTYNRKGFTMAKYTTRKTGRDAKRATLERSAIRRAKRQEAPSLTDTARAIGLNVGSVSA